MHVGESRGGGGVGRIYLGVTAMLVGLNTLNIFWSFKVPPSSLSLSSSLLLPRFLSSFLPLHLLTSDACAFFLLPPGFSLFRPALLPTQRLRHLGALRPRCASLG